MQSNFSEFLDLAKVGTIGTGGAVVSLKLADVSLIVSIAVGLMTLVYVGAKTYYLIKSGGKAGKE